MLLGDRAAGIVVGASVGCLAAGLAGIMLWRRRRRAPSCAPDSSASQHSMALDPKQDSFRSRQSSSTGGAERNSSEPEMGSGVSCTADLELGRMGGGASGGDDAGGGGDDGKRVTGHSLGSGRLLMPPSPTPRTPLGTALLASGSGLGTCSPASLPRIFTSTPAARSAAGETPSTTPHAPSGLHMAKQDSLEASGSPASPAQPGRCALVCHAWEAHSHY